MSPPFLAGTGKQDKSRREKRTGSKAAPRVGSKSRRSSKRRSSPSRSPTRRAVSKVQKDSNHGHAPRKQSGSPSPRLPKAFARNSEVTASPKYAKHRTDASSPRRNIRRDSPPALQQLNRASPPWLPPAEMTAPFVGPPLQPQPVQPSAPTTMYVPCSDKKCQAFPKISEVPWGFSSGPLPPVPDYQHNNCAPLPGQALPLPTCTHGSTLPPMQYAAGPVPAPQFGYDATRGYQMNGQCMEPGYSAFSSQGRHVYQNQPMPTGILRHYVSRANDGSRWWENNSRATTKEKASSSSATTSTSDVSSQAGGAKKKSDNARLALWLGCAGLVAFLTLYTLLNVVVGGRRSGSDAAHPMTVRAEDDAPVVALHRLDPMRQEAPHLPVLNASSAEDAVTSRHSKAHTEKDDFGKERSLG
ncbi:hypothetical protein HPB50_017846 [Hyalomma asiaticum]|uniref:Uncharacterized protein n=1 Tax=Hyalomma asiaticum TaxID=266040 RepID=A0ACB7SNC6_HYAAI|nr:hypothetical protein HPB50_017846 [Hyalomma asiaticum]